MASDRCGTDVEPVDGLRGEFLGGAGLDGVNPTRNGKLSLSLQESRVCLDELLRLQSKPSISIIPSSEVIPTPSRLLNCSFRMKEDFARRRRNGNQRSPPKSPIQLIRPSASELFITYINIANGDATSHDYGSIKRIRGRGRCR